MDFASLALARSDCRVSPRGDAADVAYRTRSLRCRLLGIARFTHAVHSHPTEIGTRDRTENPGEAPDGSSLEYRGPRCWFERLEAECFCRCSMGSIVVDGRCLTDVWTIFSQFHLRVAASPSRCMLRAGCVAERSGEVDRALAHFEASAPAGVGPRGRSNRHWPSSTTDSDAGWNVSWAVTHSNRIDPAA